MLEILAIAPEDGWAFVREGERVRLIRPPYTKLMSAMVCEETVARSVSRHGFRSVCDEEGKFNSWRELIGYIESTLVAARKARGEAIEVDAGEQLLEFAPEEILAKFLDRVERELIPNAAWEHAEHLLLKMLAMKSFRTRTELADRAVELLNRMREEQTRIKEGRIRLASGDLDFDRDFPRASLRFGKTTIDACSRAIQERGTVFAFVD